MKKIINTTKAPKALGPYSQAVKIGNFLFTSGQLGLDPVTGNLVKGGVESETRQTLENLKNILEEVNFEMKDVIKTTIFITNMEDFSKINEIYSEFFEDLHPSRSTVEVSAIAKGACIEIEAIAFKE